MKPQAFVLVIMVNVDIIDHWSHCLAVQYTAWRFVAVGILAWIFFGLIAGALAKFVMPGTQGGGFIFSNANSDEERQLRDLWSDVQELTVEVRKIIDARKAHGGNVAASARQELD
jgi:hypothetical protein